MTKDEFIKRAHNIHGNQFKYFNLPNKITTNTRIKLKCTYHNYTYSTQVRTHICRKAGCWLCRNDNIAKNKTKNTKWFIAAAKQKHKDKYSYINTIYVGTKQKVVILCPLHGTFNQTPNDHLSGYGCPECGKKIRRKNNKITTNMFIHRAIVVHSTKYDYTQSTYEHNKKKLLILCPKHGPFLQTPNSHLNGCGCPKCKASKGELIILHFLLDNNIEHEYQKHQYYNNTNLWFDFVINKNIVIEVDGVQHKKRNLYFHKSEQDFLQQQYRDALKSQYCSVNNLSLHRIEYTGKNLNCVLNTLQQILQESV